ncbi:TerB family tellurite resistance protein [uncultured Cocleimonas sp.]|uniref:tellurite resistance TerB family protein n=1 Tax=uncultured Cocleimonas sp. TaxID=1051587 RepID=UPI00262B06F4|nr:TerB family tellurite resistance protein [uncultured Cocleimonas sp.]
MLPKIKQFFESHFIAESSSSELDSEHRLQLALASLMIEVAEADYENAPEERVMLLKLVEESFDLDQKEAKELIDLAKQEHAESTDNFQFTSLINQHYSATQRIELIEKLWRVAFADNVLDKHEDHVIRRIADLIHVSHSDFIASKLRIQKESSLS